MAPTTDVLLKKIIDQYLETSRSSLPPSIPKFSWVESDRTTLVDQQAMHLAKHQQLNLPTVFPAVMTEQEWPALQIWSPQYFKDVMGNEEVTVAITPDGMADAIVDHKFVYPLEEKHKIADVMHWMEEHSQRRSTERSMHECAGCNEVWYLQLQNGSLDLEYQTLQKDIPAAGLKFASVLSNLGDQISDVPPLTNIWVGNHRSITSLHHDPFENLYCQVLGSKTITLYPPQEWQTFHESNVPTYKYARTSKGTLEQIDQDCQLRWTQLSNDGRYTSGRRQYQVTLNPGDCLYLPALWFHQVTQGTLDGDICVSINYWYDMDYFGSVWREWRTMRKIGLIASGNPDVAENELNEEENGL